MKIDGMTCPYCGHQVEIIDGFGLRWYRCHPLCGLYDKKAASREKFILNIRKYKERTEAKLKANK